MLLRRAAVQLRAPPAARGSVVIYSMAAAEIRPHATTKYTYKQSKFANVPELPLRAVLVAPSGGGKTTLLVSLILDVFKRCWRSVYVFSPTALLDDAWKPIQDFCEDTLRQEEPCLYDRYSEEALQGVIEKHHRITAMAKKRGDTRLHGALVIIDDFADSPSGVRGSKSLHELYVRGRHCGLSVVSSVQKYRALHPIIRVNATPRASSRNTPSPAAPHQRPSPNRREKNPGRSGSPGTVALRIAR